MQVIKTDLEKNCFVEKETGNVFYPVGFNYDHDEHFRLIEDYWFEDWDKVLYDFERMQRLGANTIRLHLQTIRFLPEASQPDNRQLAQLQKLIETAASMSLYLNITGLCAYHLEDQPDWYTYQKEEQRWQTQADFWTSVSQVTRGHNNIFCLNLMNEPIIAGGARPAGKWLGNSYVDGKHYTQFVALKGKGRDRSALARQWISLMRDAIKREDTEHMVTVGMMDWSLEIPSKMNTGFTPHKMVDLLDFISLHIYPSTGEEELFVKTVKAFLLGKPVVLEEFSHIDCEPEELPLFLEKVKQDIQGLLTFYTDLVDKPHTDYHFIHNKGMQEVYDFFDSYGRSMFSV